MFILAPETLRNPAVLETRSLPKKIFGRVQILPRGAGAGLWLRLLAEVQLLRYFAALLPIVALLAVSRDLAMPITQAPLAMIVLIALVEMRVLRLSDRARDRLMSRDHAERIRDAFDFRARAVLRRIAARRGIAAGEIMLFAEQSDLARLPPLTLVSVQAEAPAPHVLPLDAGDRAALGELFDADLTERDLHRANLRLGETMRAVRIEAAGVSAHARLAAWLEADMAEA